MSKTKAPAKKASPKAIAAKPAKKPDRQCHQCRDPRDSAPQHRRFAFPQYLLAPLPAPERPVSAVYLY
jgi:hypothetical protein